jgi:nucleoside-diphosphate-sugar epimerase
MNHALVTGSAGFLGRHFVRQLQQQGYVVAQIDVADARPDDGRTGQHGHVIRDALELFSPRGFPIGHDDLVIHCAAVSPHRSAIDGTPLTVGAGNLELDAAMFQWAARTKPGRVVYISSSAAYPKQGQLAKNHWALDEAYIDLEHSQGDPDAIYGWVKLTGERLAEAYQAQGGAVTVVRPFSGYGEDQSTDFPFGAFVARAQRREDPFVVWGDGTQVRDWVHVDDVVAGTLAAAGQGADGPLNICTGVGTSMRELAELVCREAGYSPRLEFRPDAPVGVAYRVGDPAKLHEIYTPKVTLEEGVRRAVRRSNVPA